MQGNKEFFQDSDKQLVIDFCKRHIETNGYCSLYYAANQACINKKFQDEDHELAFMKSVSSIITQKHEYRIKGLNLDGNFDIEKNPAYKKKKYFERHTTQEKLLIALFSAILGSSLTYLANLKQRRNQERIDIFQDQQITGLKDSIANLKKQLFSPYNSNH